MMYKQTAFTATLPLLRSNLIVFVGVADTFMVSYAGEAVVSGVALVGYHQLPDHCCVALCTGGAVVASQYLGSGDRQKVAPDRPLIAGWCPAHRTCYLSRC